jgi:hypothetical protein
MPMKKSGSIVIERSHQLLVCGNDANILVENKFCREEHISSVTG